VVLQQGEAALARIAQAAQPNGTPQLGEVHSVRRPLLSADQNSAAEKTAKELLAKYPMLQIEIYDATTKTRTPTKGRRLRTFAFCLGFLGLKDRFRLRDKASFSDRTRRPFNLACAGLVGDLCPSRRDEFLHRI
jgi:hypothetical protein